MFNKDNKEIKKIQIIQKFNRYNKCFIWYEKWNEFDSRITMNNILHTVYSPIIDIIQNGNNLEGLQENNNQNKDIKKKRKKKM